MRIDEIKSKLNSSEYDFIQTNPFLNDNIILLGLGGSCAYGTNTENSDLDIRGCAYSQPDSLLGIKKDYEQVIDSKTDTVIYSLNKLTKLLCECNPNTIEILGCNPEHYITMTNMGKHLLDNKELFLSKKAAASFGGYANSQLIRLVNVISNNSIEQSEKEENLLRSLNSSMLSYKYKYTELPEGSLLLNIKDSNKMDLDSEIFINVNLKNYPLRDFKNVTQDMDNIIKTYDKIQLTKRNRKKGTYKLAKHMCHLIRLYMMGIDILSKKEIKTYRDGNDHELLMDIRDEKYLTADGKIQSSFNDILKYYEKEYEYAKNNTTLPDYPDYEKINELIMDINMEVINKWKLQKN